MGLTQVIGHVRKTTLAARLVRRIGAIVIVVSAISFAVVAIVGRQMAVQRFEQVVMRSAYSVTELLKGRIDLVESTTRLMALDMEDGGVDVASFDKTYLAKVVESTPLIFGAGVVLTDQGDPDAKMHAPYVFRDRDRLQTQKLRDVTQTDWYKSVVAKNEEHWTFPYEHPSLPVRLMTYAVPIQRDGRLIAIAYTDLSLTQLEAEMANSVLSAHGYAFTLSSSGKSFASHRVVGLAEGLDKHPLPEDLFKSERGLIEVDADPCYGQRAWIYHSRMESYDAIFCMVYPAQDVLAALHYVELLLVLTGVVYLVVLLGLVNAITRSITAPVQALEKAAHAASMGNLDVQMPDPGTNDELATIPISFNRMMAHLRDFVGCLRRAAAEQERVSSEMNIAREVQESFLDHSRWARSASVDVQAQCVEAREVGGDFYDFFTLDDGRVGLILGDSSGHGMGAALFMAVCRTLVRAYAPQSESPAACLEAVSRRMYQENETMMFVTAVYGVLDTRRGTLILCNAGHPPPLLMRTDGALEALPSPRSRPLAIRPDSKFTLQEVKMRPGDRVVLYSDGVTEAENCALERFETTRLESTLRSAVGLTTEEIVTAVDKAVRAFAAGAEPSDDRSVMVVEWKGPRIELPRRIESATEAQKWIDAVLPDTTPRKQVLELHMAIEETLVNVVSYGGKGDVIWIAASVVADEILLTIAYEGPEFDPTAQRPPSSPRKIGGHGIELIRASVDEMTYARKGDRNVLRLRKRLGVQAHEPAAENEGPGGTP